MDSLDDLRRDDLDDLRGNDIDGVKDILKDYFNREDSDLDDSEDEYSFEEEELSIELDDELDLMAEEFVKSPKGFNEEDSRLLNSIQEDEDLKNINEGWSFNNIKGDMSKSPLLKAVGLGVAILMVFVIIVKIISFESGPEEVKVVEPDNVIGSYTPIITDDAVLLSNQSYAISDSLYKDDMIINKISILSDNTLECYVKGIPTNFNRPVQIKVPVELYNNLISNTSAQISYQIVDLNGIDYICNAKIMIGEEEKE